MKRILMIALVALAAFSCLKNDPEIPAKKEPVMVSIPFSVKAEVTKVSYDGTTGYSRKAGDQLRVKGADREDITALLSYNSGSGEWSGTLWYDENEGAPVAVGGEGTPTPLTVTLVHADNTDESTYAHSCAATFQEAVEKLSLLTGSLDFGSTDAVTLHQQASFLTTNITFNFVGVGSMPTGETSVDVIVGGETLASGTATLVDNGAKSLVYTASFVLALPGGTALTAEDYVEVCDRKIPLANVTLNANKNRNLNRSVNFKPELGDPYWSDGTYGRVAHSDGVEVVGIIVFVNNYEDSDETDLAVTARALTEKDYGYGHALVMSLNNAASAVKWRNSNSQQKNSTTYITTPAETLVAANVSGYHNSDLQAGCTAVDYALNYRSGDVHTGTDSGWFLPTIGQWLYSISTRGFGGADPVETWTATDNKNWLTNGQLSNLVGVMRSTSSENALVLSLNSRMEVLKQHLGCDYNAFGMSQGTYYGDNYWTSSETGASNAIRMNFGSMEQIPAKSGNWYSTIKTASISKGNTAPNSPYDFCIIKVRPFLAF